MRTWILCLLLSTLTNPATLAAQTSAQRPGWTLVWNDEFSGGRGSVPDRSKWVLETGGNGWGNNELEYYTNRVENVQVNDGKLVITARREGYSDSQGVFRGYTSARMRLMSPEIKRTPDEGCQERPYRNGQCSVAS